MVNPQNLNGQELNQFKDWLKQGVTLDTIIGSKLSAAKRMQALPPVGSEEIKKQITEELKKYDGLANDFIKYWYGGVFSDWAIDNLLVPNYMQGDGNGNVGVNPTIQGLIVDMGSQVIDKYKSQLNDAFTEIGYKQALKMYDKSRFTKEDN